MNSVNKTLYIPLYGKAYVSEKGIILKDPKAEEIWKNEGFPLKGKAKSKWLAYYMGMRSAVFDRWVKKQMELHPDAVVLHLGCGLDSRILRVEKQNQEWYDVDFPKVIEERKRYFEENDGYHMIGADVRTESWLDRFPKRHTAILVLEGISMYFTPEELKCLLVRLQQHFGEIYLLMDCYTKMAAKASKVKNPINEVGVTEIYGMDDPKQLENKGIAFVKEHEITPQDLISELNGAEKTIFKYLYAGTLSKKLYKLYEYRGNI
jgi:O-methyltransferase involved in polyketide biosynthesis